MGRREHAHVDRDRPGCRRVVRCGAPGARAAASPARGAASSPISSRKSVPPEAASKRPMRRSRGVGEGAPLVAEQLALDQPVGDRGAVDGDEGTLAARPQIVDGPRDQLLAGAALAPDQHRDLRHRDATDGLEDLLHDGAAAEQAPELILRRDLRAQPHHLALQLAAREQLAHLDAERLHLEGLGQVVGGAELHGLDGGGDGPGAAQHDHRRRRRPAARAPRAGRSRCGRASRGRAGSGPGAPRRAARSASSTLAGGHHLALLLEQHAKRFLHPGLVVDHQDARHVRD